VGEGVWGHRRGGGRGPQTDKTPAAKPLYRSIFETTKFGIAFYQSSLSTTESNTLSCDLPVDIKVKLFYLEYKTPLSPHLVSTKFKPNLA